MSTSIEELCLPPQAKLVIKLWNNEKHKHKYKLVKVGEKVLTYTQFTVFILAVSGLTTRSMAAHLGRSVSTIDKHLEIIRHKLNARTINALTHIAIKHNLIIAGEFTQQ